MAGEPQIVVEGLRHAFRPPRGREIGALNGVSLGVFRREFVAILCEELDGKEV